MITAYVNGPTVHIDLWRVSIGFGWFWGNNWTLANVSICEFDDRSLYTILDIQILKFSLGILIN